MKSSEAYEAVHTACVRVEAVSLLLGKLGDIEGEQIAEGLAHRLRSLETILKNLVESIDGDAGREV